VGVVSGDIALYWIGRHWGERILDWGWVRRVLSPAREEALKRMYRRHAVKTIFTARHIVGFRAAAFLTAGIAHVPFVKFLAIDLLAAFISVPLGFGLAFFFTDQLALLLLIASGVVWAAALAWRRNRRLARERAALPRSAASD
jgi:membrane protein DedA with SNARE-associated domain